MIAPREGPAWRRRQHGEARTTRCHLRLAQGSAARPTACAALLMLCLASVPSSAVLEATWSLSPRPMQATERPVFVHSPKRGVVLAYGGTTTPEGVGRTHTFDPVSQLWTSVSVDASAAPPGIFGVAAAAVGENMAVTFGGYWVDERGEREYSDTVNVFHFDTFTWSRPTVEQAASGLPEFADVSLVAASATRVVVFGGYVMLPGLHVAEVNTEVRLLEVPPGGATVQWSTVPSHVSSVWAATLLVGSHVLIVGGCSSVPCGQVMRQRTLNLDTWEVVDDNLEFTCPAGDTCEAPPLPRVWHTAPPVANANGVWPIVGGCLSPNSEAVHQCEVWVQAPSAPVPVLDVSNPQRPRWTTAAIDGLSPRARLHGSAAAVGTQVLVWGGATVDEAVHNVEVLDQAPDATSAAAEWTTLNVPYLRGTSPPSRYDAAGATVIDPTTGRELMVVYGGCTSEVRSLEKIGLCFTLRSDVWSLDLATMTWTARGSAPFARTAHQGLALGGRYIYYFGGFWAPLLFATFARIPRLDTWTWTWSELTIPVGGVALPRGCFYPAVAHAPDPDPAKLGKVVIAGGGTLHGSALVFVDYVSVLDLDSLEYQTLSNQAANGTAPSPAAKFGLVVYQSRYAYVFGGLKLWFDKPATHVFDLQTSKWRELDQGPLHEGSTLAVLRGDKIIVMHHPFIVDFTIGEISVFDIPLETWTTVPRANNAPRRQGMSWALIGQRMVWFGGVTATDHNVVVLADAAVHTAWLGAIDVSVSEGGDNSLCQMDPRRHACNSAEFGLQHFTSTGEELDVLVRSSVLPVLVVIQPRPDGAWDEGPASVATPAVIMGAPGHTPTLNCTGRCLSIRTGSADDPPVVLRNLNLVARGGKSTVAMGGAIHVEFASLTVEDCAITGFTATTGGAIYARNAQLVLQNTQLNSNSATTGGALACISSAVTLTNTVLQGNHATAKGGAWHSEFSTSTADADTVFVDNRLVVPTAAAGRAAAGGAIYSFGDFQLDISSTLRGNRIGTPVENSRRRLATAGCAPPGLDTLAGVGGALYSLAAKSNLSAATFEGNAARSGGAVYLGLQAECDLISSRLASNQAASQGGAVAAVDAAVLRVRNTVCTGNTAVDRGGCWYLERVANAAFDDRAGPSTTVGNTASCGDGGGIYLDSSPLLADSLQLEGNSAPVGAGAGVFWAPRGLDYGIEHPRVGGELMSPSTPVGAGNAARFGPVIATGLVTLRVRDGHLLNASAQHSGETVSPAPSVQLLDYFGQQMASDNTTAVSVRVVAAAGPVDVQGESIVAAAGGVATFGSLKLVANVTTVLEFWAPAYEAVDGTRIQLSMAVCRAGWRVQGTSCQRCEAGTFSRVPGSRECLPCPTGTFQALASQTTCGNCSAGTASAATGVTQCAACIPGRHAPTSGRTTCLPCLAGTYAGRPGQVDCDDCEAGRFAGAEQSSCSACSPGTFSEPQSSSCIECPPGRYAPESGAAACQLCPAGQTAARGQQVCQVCPPGTAADETHTQCLPCPTSGTVCADGLVSLLSGFWYPGADASGVSAASALANVTIVPCFHASACGTSPNGTLQCAPGHTGLMCGECLPGHARSMGGSCNSCPSASVARLTAWSLAGIAAGVLWLLMWLAHRHPRLLPEIRIVVHTLQTQFLLALYTPQLPGPVLVVSSWMWMSAGIPWRGLLIAECGFGVGLLDAAWAFAGSAVVLCTMLAALATLRRVCCGTCGQSHQRFHDVAAPNHKHVLPKAPATCYADVTGLVSRGLAALALLCLAPFAASVLEMLNIADINGVPVFRATSSPTGVWSPYHLAAVATGTGLLAALAGWLGYAARQLLREFRAFRSSSGEAPTLWLARMAVFTAGYPWKRMRSSLDTEPPRSAWLPVWELSAVTIRKLVLVTVCVFVRDDFLRALLCVAVLSVAIMLQASVQPLVRRGPNLLDLACLLVLLITQLGALLTIQAQTQGTGTSTSLAVGLVVVWAMLAIGAALALGAHAASDAAATKRAMSAVRRASRRMSQRWARRQMMMRGRPVPGDQLKTMVELTDTTAEAPGGHGSKAPYA